MSKREKGWDGQREMLDQKLVVCLQAWLTYGMLPPLSHLQHSSGGGEEAQSMGKEPLEFQNFVLLLA